MPQENIKGLLTATNMIYLVGRMKFEPFIFLCASQVRDKYRKNVQRKKRGFAGDIAIR